MYKMHNPIIAKYAMKNPQNLKKVVEFVFATIQTPISRSGDVRKDITEHGTESRYLSSAQAKGIAYLYSNLEEIHDEVKRTRSATDAVITFMRIPGLGMVKAAFSAQLCGFDVGCIDRHNLERYGVKPGFVRVSKSVKADTLRRRVEDYVELCRDVGGTEAMWDEWCDYVAGQKYNKSLPTGMAVSKYHVEAVGA